MTVNGMSRHVRVVRTLNRVSMPAALRVHFPPSHGGHYLRWEMRDVLEAVGCANGGWVVLGHKVREEPVAL